MTWEDLERILLAEVGEAANNKEVSHKVLLALTTAASIAHQNGKDEAHAE